MKQIRVKCPAKINVFFNILGLDDRNYHLIHGLNQSISLYDYLTVKVTNTNNIVLSCNDNEIPTNEKNSVYKAAKLFLDYTQISTGLDIFIEKNIPTQAGLGGESTDAAGIILALNSLFNTNLTNKELNYLGYKTSCDVPFCIEGGSKEVEGCGEIIKPWTNPYKFYLVVTPNIGHSTKDMFNLFDTKTKEYKELTPCIGYNDFHKVLNQEILNLIETIKNTNSITAMLTGSGSSVIGIYNTEKDLNKAYEILKKSLNPNYKINKTNAVNGIDLINL